MQKLLIATLFLSLAGCSEDAPPPKPKKAPDSAPAKKAETKPLPPPPPPPPAPEPPKSQAPPPKVLVDPTLPEWSQTAPAEFKAKFSTTKGDIVIQVTREWAPRGADRFYCLVKNGYYNDVRFFRVIAGFMAQFGINGHPDVNAAWKNATIQDDPVTQKNVRGTITYAMRGKNTRTTQIFINYDDRNTRLDGDGFAPFGKVVEGMEVVDKLFAGYGEGPPRGNGPNQMRLQAEGNEYLKAEFKDLDYVKSATIVQ